MPPRKPFRPDKTRDRGRAPHGSRDAESSRPGTRRDNESQVRKKPTGQHPGKTSGKTSGKSWGKDRPQREVRAASPRYSAKSTDSKPRPERLKTRPEKSDEVA